MDGYRTFCDSFIRRAVHGNDTFQRKWLMYRNTCNQLLSIQRQNAMHTYRKEDEKYEARLQYVQAVEELVGDEAKQWYAVNKKEQRKNKRFS